MNWRRFIGLSSLLLAPLVGTAQTAEETPEAADPAEVAPVEEPTISWREHYTLGPGDVINIRYYGRGELDRTGVRIAPDGAISYLQVNSLPVDGLTIDQAREALETALSRYFRNPRLIVTPEELISKRYVILGKVIDKGVFTLDRPITVLEAIARSRGIETGLLEQSTVEIADLQRSFIVRHGERLPIDFEALYFEGDLSQNVGLEPGDYIYIASNLNNEFYVLGAVAQPGVQPLASRTTVVQAITRREGFAPGAWRERVVLIRGSIEEPEVIVVNVARILHGEEPDIPIEPNDILYVHDRPWYRVEQIIDRAVLGYIQSATSTWVNENVPAAIQDPFLPRTRWKD